MRFNFPGTSPTQVKQMTPKQALFVSPIFGVVGLALTIFWGIPTAQNAMKSADWPVIGGRVTVSAVSENYDSNDSNTTYTAKVTYVYIVDGNEYMGSTVAFGDFGSSDPAHASRIVMRYPVGESVQVSYDPREPQTSVLEPGAGWSSFIGIIVGTLFLFIGIIGFVVARRKVRSGITTMGSQTIPPVPSQQ